MKKKKKKKKKRTSNMHMKKCMTPRQYRVQAHTVDFFRSSRLSLVTNTRYPLFICWVC